MPELGFTAGFVAGALVGAAAGIFVMCLAAAAGWVDASMEERIRRRTVERMLDDAQAQAKAERGR